MEMLINKLVCVCLLAFMHRISSKSWPMELKKKIYVCMHACMNRHAKFIYTSSPIALLLHYSGAEK